MRALKGRAEKNDPFQLVFPETFYLNKGPTYSFGLSIPGNEKYQPHPATPQSRGGEVGLRLTISLDDPSRGGRLFSWPGNLSLTPPPPKKDSSMSLCLELWPCPSVPRLDMQKPLQPRHLK